MNTIIYSFPQLARKKLIYDNLTKHVYDGTKTTAEVLLIDHTEIIPFHPYYLDGIYGTVIGLNKFLPRAHFIHKIQIKCYNDANEEIHAVTDIYFYARGYHVNINEYGEDSHIPFLYLQNNINNLYVNLNKSLCDSQNVTKIAFMYQECQIVSKKKLKLMYNDLPPELFDASTNKCATITCA